MRIRPALLYTVLRLLAFLVPFGVLMLFPIFRELYWLAAIFAALIGLSLSLLFLRRPLADATGALSEGRAPASKGAPRVRDEDVEDAAVRAAAPVEPVAPAAAARASSPSSSPSSRLSADEGPEQERAVGDRGQ